MNYLIYPKRAINIQNPSIIQLTFYLINYLHYLSVFYYLWINYICLFTQSTVQYKYIYLFSGLDIRWYLVSYMASCWCLDVHRINIKFMCNIAGSICCSNKTGYISKYYVNKTCKITNSWNMGFIVCYMFSPSCWMERTKGNYIFFNYS